MAKTQNPLCFDPGFKEFTVPSLSDFVAGDGDKAVALFCQNLKEVYE